MFRTCGAGIHCFFGPGIRKGKFGSGIRDQGSGINISDHISKSSVTDPDWKNPDSGSGIKDAVPGPGINIPDPHHCLDDPQVLNAYHFSIITIKGEIRKRGMFLLALRCLIQFLQNSVSYGFYKILLGTVSTKFCLKRLPYKVNANFDLSF